MKKTGRYDDIRSNYVDLHVDSFSLSLPLDLDRLYVDLPTLQHVEI